MSLSLSTVVMAGVTHAGTTPAGDCIAADGSNVDIAHAQTLPAPQACITATNADGMQGVYWWTLDDAAAAQRWTLAMSAVPGQAVTLQVHRVEVDGSGLTLSDETLASADGGPGEGATITDVLLPPGRYIVGSVASGPGAYQVDIAPGAPIPAVADTEPNDSAEQAAAVSGEFGASGDRAGTPDWFAWDVGAESGDGGATWQLSLQVPAATTGAMRLVDGSGAELAARAVDAEGRLRIPDMALSPGRYFVEVASSTEATAPYVLEATTAAPAATAGGDVAEAEPNDTIAGATSVDVAVGSTSVAGRLATIADGTDTDMYRFAVDADTAGRLVDVKLFWRGGSTRELCLVDADGVELRCDTGDATVAFNDVVLDADDYGVTVSGVADADDPYLLRFDVTEEATSGFEAEPNETMEQATPMATNGDDDGFTAAGRLSGTEGADTDVFRFTVDGEPQLWEITATGEGVEAIDALDATGSAEFGGSLIDGAAVITDLFLLPGEHAVSVAGLAGDYTIDAVPLGPPDPLGEREPNDESDRSEALRLAERHVGRLALTDDVDMYRFALRNDSYVRIEIETPSDGQVELQLSRGADAMGTTSNAVAGEPIVYDTVLPPGDYVMRLSPITTSDEPYHVSVTPLDPYRAPDDAEPNDSATLASPLPADGTATGTIDAGNPFGDMDWYAVAPFDEPSTTTVRVDGESMSVEATTLATAITPATPLGVTPTGNLDEYTIDVPADTPVAIGVRGTGDYELRVTPPADAVADTAADAADGDLGVAWAGCDHDVAAYWHESQRLSCTLEISNDGDTEVDASIDAVAGDHRWAVTFGDEAPTVEAGDTVEVDATIVVAPDAWADDAVLIAARVRTADGWQSATTTIVPNRDAVPLDPVPFDPLPPELLGGLDAASAGLGAVPIALDEASSTEELLLHDGLAALGQGWTGSTIELPLELTVDLAGDEPVPVVGFTLNARGGLIGDQLRDFDIELSLDGQTFTPVLTDEMEATGDEQSFVLAEPSDARYARLRLRSTQSPAATNVYLAEWGVIADTAWTPNATGFNLASAELGGHVVSVQPAFGGTADIQTLTVADGVVDTGTAEPGSAVDIVIGFQHDRAAQLAALTWTDPPESDPATRFAAVDVALSLAGGAGPWTDVGRWTLDRSDGEIAPFMLPPGTWARFVRLTGVAPASPAATAGTDPAATGTATDPVPWEVPDAIGVIEQPTTDDDPSVLGAWGFESRSSAYERTVTSTAVELDADAGDTEAEATLLELGTPVNESAQVGRDEDWYRVEVPADESALAISVGGTPSVDVDVALFDADGHPVALEAERSSSGTASVFTAVVEPGGEYVVQVTEPPTSVVFAFDTSLSMGPYSSAVYRGVANYAGDVAPGQETVNVLPFGADMLLDSWVDEPYAIQAAVNNYPRSATSSDAEGSLVRAMEELGTQPGARAIVLVTDAQTSPDADLLDQLWSSFGATQPRVYAVHVAGGTAIDQDLMEDWASVNSGLYTYVTDQGGIDVAFDRAATALRRPSQYSLSVATVDPPTPPTTTSTTTTTTVPTTTTSTSTTSTSTTSTTSTSTTTTSSTTTSTSTTMPAAPGLLALTAFSADTAGASAAPGAASVAIILDTSGSMLQDLDTGGERIDAARGALETLVTQTLPAGTNVSLRVFGSAPDSCETQLLVPQSPLDPAAMAAVVREVPVVDGVRTPLGASLQQVAGDLGALPGPKIVVLVTDGEETCNGDPAAAINALVASGIDVRVNIVGFALDDAALKAQFQEWARLGNGQYIDANDQASLTTAMTIAVQPTYDVVDGNGIVVASGQAGGPPVSLPAGTYTVVVHATPERRVTATVVAGQRTNIVAG